LPCRIRLPGQVLRRIISAGCLTSTLNNNENLSINLRCAPFSNLYRLCCMDGPHVHCWICERDCRDFRVVLVRLAKLPSVQLIYEQSIDAVNW
jgi:hypothetical protein